MSKLWSRGASAMVVKDKVTPFSQQLEGPWKNKRFCLESIFGNIIMDSCYILLGDCRFVKIVVNEDKGIKKFVNKMFM